MSEPGAGVSYCSPPLTLFKRMPDVYTPVDPLVDALSVCRNADELYSAGRPRSNSDRRPADRCADVDAGSAHSHACAAH